MRHRLQIALIFLAPVVLVGALYLLGLTIPVPALGRDYVIRVVLPDANRPEVRQAILGRQEGFEVLEAQDIADAIGYMVTRPRHVNVNEIMVRPTEIP